MENQRDATILAFYADLIWQSNRDAQRAKLYFDQAVQAAPQDWYAFPPSSSHHTCIMTSIFFVMLIIYSSRYN